MLTCSRLEMKPLEPCQFMSAKGLVHDVLLNNFPDFYINTLSPNCLCSETSAVKHRVHTALLWELQLYFLSLTYLGQYFYLLTVLCAYWRKGALYSVHPIYAHLPHLYVHTIQRCSPMKWKKCRSPWVYNTAVGPVPLSFRLIYRALPR